MSASNVNVCDINAVKGSRHGQTVISASGTTVRVNRTIK